MNFRKQLFEKQYTLNNIWLHPTIYTAFGYGLLHREIPKYLPTVIDLPIRYNLASIAGAAAINLLSADVVGLQIGKVDQKRYSTAQIVGSSIFSSAGIIAIEHAQSKMPNRHFDYVDTVGGLTAIFMSAVLLCKLSSKELTNQSARTPQTPSAPGLE